MNYQVGKNQSGNITNATMGMAAFGGSDKGSSVWEQNKVGDLLACKLVKGGKEPILDMNGIQIKTKATKELENAKEGDTIYLRIQQADRNQVSLKIVRVGNMNPEETAIKEGLDVATNTQIMQSTKQFSEMVKDNIGGALDEERAKENQKEILRSISPEEIAKLRMMQIDVTNSTLSDLMGMVISIRSNEHQDEVNEMLGDIVESTLAKLKESVAPKSAMPEEQYGTGEAEVEVPPVTTSNLNSEGYVVTRVIKPSNAQKQKGISSYGVDNYGKNGYTDEGAAGTKKNTVENGIVNEENEKKNIPIEIRDEQLVYLIKNGKELTIANIEQSRNSVNFERPFDTLPFSEQVWNDIYPQVTGIIEAAGMSVNEQSLSGAQFMLTHELPITVDSLRTYMTVQALNQRGFASAQARKNIAEQIGSGNPPEEAHLSASTIRERAQQLVEKVKGISQQTVDSAVRQGKPLTISYLYNHGMRSVDVRQMRGPINTGVEGASLSLSGATQEGIPVGENGVPLSTNPSAITARRQLEEIRLSMTLEVAVRLVKSDFNIDAKPLSQLVDSLRQQENQYFENVVAGRNLHSMPEDENLFVNTMKKTNALKELPAYALAEIVKKPSITVDELHTSASHTKALLAESTYEKMRTKPRRDRGDTMEEAFRNVDDLLKELRLDSNEQNRRAVRILAYNEMELTKQNITSVKEADLKVQQMFETLTPQIVLNLIRENKNPLNMTVDGLNEEIMQQREIRGITDEQKFSEFLYQMDKNDAISKEERTSFIGIYRLLDKVQKSHGKDIGAVIRNGQEVTLKHLFEATKSRKAAGMDVSVHENFGERVPVETTEQAILTQIETAYHRSLTNSIMRHISPDTLKGMQTLDYRNMSFEELNACMVAGDDGLGQEDLAKDLNETILEAVSYEEEMATMLEANDMQVTATNLIAAHQVMYGEDGIYGMVRLIKKGLPKSYRERIAAQEERVLDGMESREDLVYSMENLRATVANVVHEAEQETIITAKDIQALKYLNAGMPIAMRAVEEDEFRIPLVVDGKVSVMKVSLLHDGMRSGEVTATLQTEKYGMLEAFIRVDGNQLEGYVVTEEERGQRTLESNELTMRSVFAKAGLEIRDLRLDGTKPILYGARSEEEVTTGKLYKAAKQLVTAIKLTGITADN